MDTIKKKEEFLEAYESKANNVSLACKAVGISRQTYYNWLTDDPAFSSEVKNIDEAMLDYAETALYKQIKDGNTTSLIFYLKTKGKKRGYVERTEIAGADGAEPIRITIID
jgi:hypothetical protein